MASETVAEQFWAESHRKRERREEIAAMSLPSERLNAVLADVWTDPAFLRELNQPLRLFCGSRPDALDEWLAEDGRMPEVREALGL